MQLVVVLLLASIVFLTSTLLAAAIFMRGQWDKIGARSDSQRRPGAKPR
jgi:hypothetical protein